MHPKYAAFKPAPFVPQPQASDKWCQYHLQRSALIVVSISYG